MSQTAPKPDRLGWILGLTSTAYFMVALDALVVITALPRMAPTCTSGCRRCSGP